MWPREVPSHIFDRLMSGFLCHEAHWLLTAMRRDGGYTPDMAIHPGDPFGRVIAWPDHVVQERHRRPTVKRECPVPAVTDGTATMPIRA
jgi:hypothetical protein